MGKFRSGAVRHTLARFQPDECYNFAAYTSAQEGTTTRSLSAT